MKILNRRSYALIEYVVLAVVVLGAFVVMGNYVQRGLNGTWGKAGQSIAFGRQYDSQKSIECAYDDKLATWYDHNCFVSEMNKLNCTPGDTACNGIITGATCQASDCNPNGTPTCTPNDCAAITCTTDTCNNGCATVSGTKVCCTPDNCAATTCNTTTCNDGCETVPGTKNCGCTPDNCAATTCSDQTCNNGCTTVSGTENCGCTGNGTECHQCVNPDPCGTPAWPSCGPVDVCGLCGNGNECTCTAPNSCGTPGNCHPIPNGNCSCTQSKNCGGKICGPDACNNPTGCGSCPNGTACNVSGTQCVSTAPPTCAQANPTLPAYVLQCAPATSGQPVPTCTSMGYGVSDACVFEYWYCGQPNYNNGGNNCNFIGCDSTGKCQQNICMGSNGNGGCSPPSPSCAPTSYLQCGPTTVPPCSVANTCAYVINYCSSGAGLSSCPLPGLSTWTCNGEEGANGCGFVGCPPGGGPCQANICVPSSGSSCPPTP